MDAGRYVAAVAKALSKHPDAAVAISVSLLAIGGIVASDSDWLIVGLSSLIFVGYMWLRQRSCHHEERMALLKIEADTAKRGQVLREKAVRRLQKDDEKKGTSVPSTGRRKK